MSFKIYTSNRMEHLVEALSASLATPLCSPFTSEQIVVQSKGMQRWLSMELAKKHGVWANCVYPFPNKMVWQLIGCILQNQPDSSSFSPEIVTWKIMELLPELLHLEEFSALRNYLDDDRDNLKLYQLAGRIADTFDQYTLFRPEMVLEWESGKGAGWQELLWRNLVFNDTTVHRAGMKRDFIQSIVAEIPMEMHFPERISVFGVSYLPPYHLDVLAAVSQYTNVNLFLLSPCREYWGDIVSAREKARQSPLERDYLFEGNPLLASLGKLARDFSNMLIERDCIVEDVHDLYADNDNNMLLSTIQSDILNLRGTEIHDGKKLIREDDNSVQIHSCHSPLRETEVLFDNLLALFDTDKGLAPRDIVVMAPDIEIYAPYITMVFDSSHDSTTRIPFSIADRSLASDGLISVIILSLLDLPGSRLSAACMFDILATYPVFRRFDLDEQDLKVIRSWIEKTRIRWGADEVHRQELGLPAYRENSWAAGIDRLLLGYAMPEEGENLFNGVLPFDEMEGSTTRALGTFVEFIRKITLLKEDLSRGRTLSEWRWLLRRLLDDFICQDEALAFERSAVSGVIDSLEVQGHEASFSGQVNTVVIRSWLSTRLAQEEKGVGFLTGGVTFCSMLPMRSIPFRVVALLGMNDSAFPRQGRSPGFDLIASHPRVGDRSLRDEDRYLFLEAILSARDVFYISYVGQSIKDNSTIPPSVLVSEFLDCLNSTFTADGMKVEQRLLTMHRLQAFSKGYFDGSSSLFSYSNENCTALIQANESAGASSKFISDPLPDPPGEMREISLQQLQRFFVNPSRYLLENRLQIALYEVSAPLGEREPFSLHGLDAYCLNQELLERRLRGEDDKRFLAVAQSRGVLPPARHGEIIFAEAVKEVDELFRDIEKHRLGMDPLEPLLFNETVSNFRLYGRLDGIWSGRKIVCRCARLKAKDEIRAWLEHLVLNAFAPAGYPRETVLIMKDVVITYKQVDNAVEILRTFLFRYWSGLTLPLRFFPTTSFEFAVNGGNLDKARTKYTSGYMYKGEEDDPAFRLCFGREDDPLAVDFSIIASELLAPLIYHRSKE